MIRKAIIVLLTLGAVGAIAAWVVSYTVRAEHPDQVAVAYSYGYDYWFVEPTDPSAEGWLRVAVSRGTLHLNRWNYKASRAPSSQRWRLLGFAFKTGVYRGRQPPYSFWLLEIPLWCPIVLFTTYPALAFIRGPLRRRWRHHKGLCLKCGYNLTGNVSGVCPECGTEMENPLAFDCWLFEAAGTDRECPPVPDDEYRGQRTAWATPER
ncbi:MAG: hypothetical protein JSU86_09260 [Phycisphaerales bacterium]|nr:MAG: hypothetical protein JSU86_09260 [Phycisphaerales bacterium]